MSRTLTAAFAVGLIIYATIGLPPAFKAWSGKGTSGYFVAQNTICGRNFSCHWVGEFETAKGVITMSDVTWEGADPGFTSGSTVPALAESGETDYVYPPHSLNGLLQTIGMILGGTGLLYFAGRRRSRVA